MRYGTVWSDYVGGNQGDLEEIFLHPGESVIQVSGKYKSYVKQLIFVTDKGRYLPFGKDSGTSFNAVPLHPILIWQIFIYLQCVSSRGKANVAFL